MRLPDSRFVALCASLLLAGCASSGSGAKLAPALPANGPQDDYPVLLGDPFTIDGVTYTPEDVMNYDAVGYAFADQSAVSGVSGAHKTLPLPSYVEVTNLETGRTILVRLTERGPMRGDGLIGLSQAAAMELGMAGASMAEVRVRRVNPPEAERAMLRIGEPVPPRMDTPVALLAALKRKLANENGAQPGTIQPRQPMPTAPVTVDPDVNLAAGAADQPAMPPAPATPATTGTFVQIGAFSSKANANRVAAPVDASVSKASGLWVVRIGPLASKAEIDAALGKARAAGYGDAIVRRVN